MHKQLQVHGSEIPQKLTDYVLQPTAKYPVCKEIVAWKPQSAFRPLLCHIFRRSSQQKSNLRQLFS